MSKPYETWVTIEVPLTVKVVIYPGDPGVRTYSNGDPGYPPTGPDFDFEECWIGDQSGEWKLSGNISIDSRDLAEALRDRIEEATGYSEEEPLFYGEDQL